MSNSPTTAFSDRLLAKVGLSRDQLKRNVVLSVPKMSCGRRGLPASVVNVMWEDYQRLKSLEKVGALSGRSRQAVYAIFQARGFVLNKQKRHEPVIFNGRKFTPGKGGYLRDTIRRKGFELELHRLMWIDAHGPIQAGHQVSFKDGNNQHCSLENLFCAPLRDVVSYHYARNFSDRALLTPEQRAERKKKACREYAARKARAFRDQGLRSDGKPRSRLANGATNPTVSREWRFNYFPPVIVKEDGDKKVMRRKVASFSGKRTQFDLAYEQLRAEMEAAK
ncbi:MAG TPA: HNH endonuclease signature motif containing protein [Verrucomicrobiae bacterium]|nr:HNH endonuclease signature motif containing protein [Verrucomicrobiae bacterium]